MPKESKEKTKQGRRPRSLLLIGAVILAAVAAYLVYVRVGVVVKPLPDAFSILERQGYTPNDGLSGLFQPGNVIQVAEKGPDGAERTLATPLVFAWGSDCFSGRTPAVSDFSLPTTSGSSSASLSIGAEMLAAKLPALKIESSAVASYKLEFVDVRVQTFAKGDLSGFFSDKCVRMLRTALDSGDKVEWYRVVMEAVVAGELLMEIEWKGDASAGVKQSVTDNAEKSLAQTGASNNGPGVPFKLDVRVAGADEKKTVLSAKGLVVLAYRARPIQPKTAAGQGS